MASERDIRIEKAQKLRDRGHDPYHPAKFERSDFIGEVRRKYETSEGANNNSVSIGGRVTSIRNMGQSVFIDVQDQTGTLQVTKGKLKFYDADKYGEKIKIDKEEAHKFANELNKWLIS